LGNKGELGIDVAHERGDTNRDERFDGGVAGSGRLVPFGGENMVKKRVVKK